MLFLNTSLSLTSFKLSRYKPYINYSWSQTLTVEGNQQTKNTGNSGQNLQLFSGQGVKFNGTNQSLSAGTFSALGIDGENSVLTIACTTSTATTGVLWNTGYSSGYAGASLQIGGGLISLNSNSTENALLSTPYVAGQVVCTFVNNIWSIYINGILKTSRLFVYTTPFLFSLSQEFSIGAYRLTAQYYNGITTDVYMFTDVLTQQEIELYTNNPNKFFQDTRDGIIDNCVLNMPLHGVDKYQVDYSKYALGTSEYSTSGTYTSTISDKRIGQVTQGLLFEPNKTYSINYTLTDNINIGNFKLYISPTSNAGVTIQIEVVRTSAKQDFIVKIPSTYVKNDGNASLYFWLMVNGTPTTTDFQNISIKEISGINEVINYTADCVTGAKQLPYGSQEANFFHKSSGVPIRTGLSPFFESTPYWNNYGNTGWIPETNQEFILEAIIQNAKEGTVVIFEGLGIETNNAADFWIRQLKTTGIINLTIGTSSIDKTYIDKNFYYVSVQVRTTGVSFYIDGILVGTAIYNYNRSLNTSNRPFTIGGVNRGVIGKESTKEVRHFKVITDVKTISTYNALTNYNKLVAKGLLANFVLDENGEYLQDEFGNYIMDI